jgi:sugar phosphate isomerase/epimerase
MAITLRDTIKSTVKEHLLNNRGKAYGQCLTAVGWVGGTLPELYEEDGMVEGVLAAGDRLGYVHVGESHRGYLGTGNVDFDSFFGALKKINYQGPVTFESFSSAVVDPALSNALRIWRNLWTDSHDLADKAINFMKKRYS